MTTNRFKTVDSTGRDKLTTAITTSSGAGDANKLVSTGSNGRIDSTIAPSSGLIAHRSWNGLQAIASGANDVVVVDYTLPSLLAGDTLHAVMYAQGGGTMSASGGIWLRWLRNGSSSNVVDLYTIFNATINNLQFQRFVSIRDTDFILPQVGDTAFGANATAPLTGAIDRTQTQKIQVIFRSQNLTTTLHKLDLWLWRDNP